MKYSALSLLLTLGAAVAEEGSKSRPVKRHLGDSTWSAEHCDYEDNKARIPCTSSHDDFESESWKYYENDCASIYGPMEECVCPTHKPCLPTDTVCYDLKECQDFYHNQCHKEMGQVQLCGATNPQPIDESKFHSIDYLLARHNTQHHTSQSSATTDDCDLVSVYLPSSDADKSLSLEVHTDTFSFYTDVDLVHIAIGDDVFTFDVSDASLGRFKVNGRSTAPAPGQSAGYGTRLEADRIAVRPDSCVSASPCHNQHLEQVDRGTFKINLAPCESS